MTLFCQRLCVKYVSTFVRYFAYVETNLLTLKYTDADEGRISGVIIVNSLHSVNAVSFIVILCCVILLLIFCDIIFCAVKPWSSAVIECSVQLYIDY